MKNNKRAAFVGPSLRLPYFMLAFGLMLIALGIIADLRLSGAF